jgi:hypothetical protein
MAMINRNTAIGELGFPGRIRALWQKKSVRIALELVFLITMGAVTALGKRVSLPLGIPGHSALLWLGAMVAGRAVIRKDGAGAVMGVTAALWGVPLGLENSLVHNLWLYGLTGLALDVFTRVPFINVRNPLGAVICGMLAHMVKFGFILTTALTAGTTMHFILFGTLKSAGLHLLFGAIAGIFGWFIYWTANKARNSLEHKPI